MSIVYIRIDGAATNFIENQLKIVKMFDHQHDSIDLIAQRALCSYLGCSKIMETVEHFPEPYLQMEWLNQVDEITNQLKEQGYQIKFYTDTENVEKVKEWLNKHQNLHLSIDEVIQKKNGVLSFQKPHSFIAIESIYRKVNISDNSRILYFSPFLTHRIRKYSFHDWNEIINLMKK